MKPTTDLGIALIGTGFMGHAHSAAFRQIGMGFPELPAIRLQSIVGRKPEPREALRSRYGWTNGSDDWKSVIGRADIDLVDIATPTDLHAPIAIAAVRADKHVLCEKPMGLSVAEAEAMLEAAESAGVRHAIAFNYRFLPAIQLAKRIIADGRLGRIYHFRAHYLQDWLADAEAPMSWRLDRSVAGAGAHGDLNAHLIDLAHFLHGPIAEVAGQSATFVPVRSGQAVTVDDATSFLARFSDGALGTFEASRMATGSKNRNQIEIEGSKGALRFDLERLNELQFTSADDPPDLRGFRTILATEPTHPFLKHWWPPGHVLGWEHAHVHLIATFLDDISTGGENAPTFRDGLACQRVIEAVERSVADTCWTAVRSGAGS
jgi:predicted dehydrogenase